MQSILGLLLLCGAIYTVIAASSIHQFIGRGGVGGVDDSDERLEWSDSVHDADTDATLKRLAQLDNLGSDRARNFDGSNWGDEAVSRAGGFDRASNGDSNSDADLLHERFQLIQF